ncbi:MAG: hypothetical protein PWQ68_445 [Thermoanaerobacteraceae bacterium]|jgi:hypothetical protein|nr:hypothetical protein [Thermoanaerobacteraceae bacterium]
MWGLPGGTVFLIFYLFILAFGNLLITYLSTSGLNNKEGK